MTISKRNVFYLSGFDPRGARFYHGLYRKAADRYNELTCERVRVSRREVDGWSIANDTQDTQVEYRFLQWDDLVRKAWIKNPSMLVYRALRMYIDYMQHFEWKKILAMPRAPVVTLLYPLLSIMLLPILLAGVFSLLLPWWIAVPLAVPALLWLLVKLKVLWLLRFFVFNHRMAIGKEPEIDARLDAFAEEIVRSFAEGSDEVALVCHSNGSILAVSLLEKIAARTGGVLPPHFVLLTLGQCIPLLRCFQRAKTFNQQLEALGTRDFIWVDIGAPTDGAAYAMQNPFGEYVHKAKILNKSPQFFKYYEEATYKKMRRNKYILHFAYLQTGDKASPLDYVGLTTGSTPIASYIASL